MTISKEILEGAIAVLIPSVRQAPELPPVNVRAVVAANEETLKHAAKASIENCEQYRRIMKPIEELLAQKSGAWK